ncbi:MAG: broad specificity phosphatase PhoE [Actinomycetes bacterium]|jgi:broad specificity phosphatase PhoE
MAEETIVHLMRHGEVYNPEGILYGRLPGFHLSDLGQQMAVQVANTIKDRDIVAVWASPLERAQQTATPLAEAKGLEIHTDERIIEATNVFEGKKVSIGDGALREPKYWRYLYDPIKPSWGEPYKQLAARMESAVKAAREEARGHEIVLVSHQLPVWISRLSFEDRRLWHDPRHRQCALASLTSLVFDGDTLTAIVYTEPAADLDAKASKGAGA